MSFLHSYSAEDLLKRAVKGARDKTALKGVKHERWVAVMNLFCLGSTYSRELCEKFGLDPEEEVYR